jgi:3-deoxy-D-manno-octulosonate 8-phosphate phosphatase (KDO 8-P phosphatase)
MFTQDQIKNIKLLALDVDGVLTDGKLYFSHDGEFGKTFHSLDGHGLKMLMQQGIKTAIITGRTSQIVIKRATELGIMHLMQGREDKLVALKELSDELTLPLSDIAYMGDDLPDLGAVIHCGLGLAPANACAAVRDHADYVCSNNGGDGAVREVCELILREQGFFDDIVAAYRQDA